MRISSLAVMSAVIGVVAGAITGFLPGGMFFLRVSILAGAVIVAWAIGLEHEKREVRTSTPGGPD